MGGRKIGRAVLVLLLFATPVAGCGGGGSSAEQRRAQAPRTATTTASEAPRAPADDRSIARTSLLRASDLPLTATEQAEPPSGLSCGPTSVFRHLAAVSAISPRLVTARGEVRQTVTVFASPRSAARGFTMLDSAAHRQCLERYLRESVRQNAGASAGKVDTQVITVEPPGDQATSFRMGVPVETSVPTTVTIDIVLNRIGRCMSSISAMWTTLPPGLEFQETVAARAAARLRGLPCSKRL